MLRRISFALLLVVSGIFGHVTHASAQASACVSLLVGAGYAAEMRVVSGKFHTDWSDSFPIGKTKCQPLDGVGDGHTFSVEVHAVLGKTKTCTPADITRVASSKSSVVMQAWGSTLSVKCDEPSNAADAERDAATMKVNPDGQKAAGQKGDAKNER